MQTILNCLFITAWLPYLSKLVLAIPMSKEGGYDNNHPREQQKKLKGYGARALAAHQNSFEALLMFAIAVFASLITKSYTPLTEYLAIIFVISRIFYHLAYLMDKATIRSLFWFVGFASYMVIFITALKHLP